MTLQNYIFFRLLPPPGRDVARNVSTPATTFPRIAYSALCFGANVHHPIFDFVRKALWERLKPVSKTYIEQTFIAITEFK